MKAVALAFVVEPSETMAGAPIVPPVTVAVRTVDGDPVTTAGVAVTIAIDSNPGDGILTGTTTAETAADGVATFDDLSISDPGVGYTLIATSPGLTTDVSREFTVDAPSFSAPRSGSRSSPARRSRAPGRQQ